MSIARLSLLTFFTLALLVGPSSLGAQTPAPPTFVGTWLLTAADDLRSDGTRTPAYGAERGQAEQRFVSGQAARQTERAARRHAEAPER